MPDFVLPVHDIDELGKDYAFELTADWLAQALAETPLSANPAQPPPKLTIHAQRNGDEILVQGKLVADLHVECCRCLEPAPLSIRVGLAALVLPRAKGASAAEVELESEGPERTYYEGHQLVLDELVREHIVIECPMQPLCSPDCPGIPIPEGLRPKADDFGRAGSTDPRLAPLNDLRAKLSEKTKE